MKKITCLFILLTGVFGFSQELITDGDFESLGTGGLTNSTTVGVWTSTTSSAVQNNNANSYEGDQYINMGNDFRNLRQFFTGVANTDYTVTFWYRNNFDNVATTDAPYVSIRANDGTNNGNGTIIESFQLDPFYDANLKTYSQFTFTFNTSETDLVFYIFKDARASNTNPNNAARIDKVSIVPTSSLSIADLEKFNFKSYPNPTTDYIALSAAKNIDKIEVYDLLGKQVLTKTIDNTKDDVNVSNLSAGLYIMKAYIEEAAGTFKFVKQ